MAQIKGSMPVLDCSAIGLDIHDKNLRTSDLSDFGEKLVESVAPAGLCYLENHGINTNLMDDYFATSLNFFGQSEVFKNKYKRLTAKVWGWSATETEQLSPNRPGDLKESFSFCPGEKEGVEDENQFLWPNDEMKHHSMKVYDALQFLSLRLCDCFSLGLGLGRSVVRDAHVSTGAKGSMTTLKTLLYPPITDDSSVKPGQIRLGEHTDYDTFALLYQDDIGGLELEVPGQGFVPVSPRAGTVVLTVGGLFQRWTADRLMAGNHRVVIPEVEIQRRMTRQSIALFFMPDNDYVIRPLDGSNKYPPITTWQYLMERFSGRGFKY